MINRAIPAITDAVTRVDDKGGEHRSRDRGNEGGERGVAQQQGGGEPDDGGG